MMIDMQGHVGDMPLQLFCCFIQSKDRFLRTEVSKFQVGDLNRFV